MSPRFFRDAAMFLATAGGATIGYCAGGSWPEYQLAAAMTGMGLFGAFADICIRGDVK